MFRKPPSRQSDNRNATPEERQAALEEGRRKANRQGIIRSVIMLILLTVLAVYMALKPRDPEVVSIITATALDEDYQPVEETDTYQPDDTFAVSVQVVDFPPDAELTARWRLEGDVIRETVFESEFSGSGYIARRFNEEGVPTFVGMAPGTSAAASCSIVQNPGPQRATRSRSSTRVKCSTARSSG